MALGDLHKSLKALTTSHQAGQADRDLSPCEIEIATDRPRRLVNLKLQLLLCVAPRYQIDGDRKAFRRQLYVDIVLRPIQCYFTFLKRKILLSLQFDRFTENPNTQSTIVSICAAAITGA